MTATCGVYSKAFPAQKKLTRHLKTREYVQDALTYQLCMRMLKDDTANDGTSNGLTHFSRNG